MKELSPNIIYVDEKFIIPEIDDDDLLQFSVAFMNILQRDYKPVDNIVKKERKQK